MDFLMTDTRLLDDHAEDKPAVVQVPSPDDRTSRDKEPKDRRRRRAHLTSPLYIRADSE
jgi:hypothetical protein